MRVDAGTGAGGAGREILHVAFNQDNTCVALGTHSGILIYNLAAHKCIYALNAGAVRTVQMLFCTSLVAYVGAGQQPALTPRKLSLLNTATSTTVQDMSFPSVVLAVLINKSRLVAVLEQQACVYALQTLAHLCSVDTPANHRGLAALTACEQPCLLALPAGSASSGTLRVYNLLAGPAKPAAAAPAGPAPAAGAAGGPPGSSAAAAAGASGGTLSRAGSGAVPAAGDGGVAVLCELLAHQAPLAAMAWYHDGSLLATASSKGTVIRVHRLPAMGCVAAFRRGSVPATIHTLAWSPPNVQPPLLAVSSSRGSVHIFRLDEEVSARQTAALGMRAVGGAGGLAVGLLSAVMRLAPGNSPLVGPQPSIASVRLPVESAAACVGLLPRPAANRTSFSGAAAAGGGAVGAPTAGAADGAPAEGSEVQYDADSVTLVVATLDGILYEYGVSKLHSTNPGRDGGPACVLEGEWALAGSSLAANDVPQAGSVLAAVGSPTSGGGSAKSGRS